MKHTPGPWDFYALLSGSENHKGYRITTGESKWLPIATVIPMDSDGLEGSANARLIAAAPDLLSALGTMLTEFGMDEDKWNKPTFDQARRAVAKATGNA